MGTVIEENFGSWKFGSHKTHTHTHCLETMFPKCLQTFFHVYLFPIQNGNYMGNTYCVCVCVCVCRGGDECTHTHTHTHLYICNWIASSVSVLFYKDNLAASCLPSSNYQENSKHFLTHLFFLFLALP